ncbi:MAG: GNAT family N-acetyltransferase [Nocardioidaceae bacterium]
MGGNPAGLPDESQELADLIWRVRAQNAGSIPSAVHPLDDMRAWMRDVVLKACDVWVAEAGSRPAASSVGRSAESGVGAVPTRPGLKTPVGLMVLRQPDWIDHLYIEREYTGQGLGASFLELARRELAGPHIQLWTFQSNHGAGRFYERHGFDAVQWTNGDNEERAPDVRYRGIRPTSKGT